MASVEVECLEPAFSSSSRECMTGLRSTLHC